MLIIPDIHEQVDQLQKIDNLFGTTEPRIYLGDWVDSFKSTDKSRQDTLDYLAAELALKDRTFLWGNHDYQYHDHNGRCSGYSKDMASRIASTLPTDWADHFKPFTSHGTYMISHAGFNKPPEDWPTVKSMLLAVGYSRGGKSPVGGPLWLDWEEEFNGIPNEFQIVGHTRGKHPRIHPRGICIDCDCRYVLKFTKRHGMESLEIVPV